MKENKPSPYRAFLTAVRTASRCGVVDTVELRSAFDECADCQGGVTPEHIERIAQRIKIGRSVLWFDSPLSTRVDESDLPPGGRW